MDEDTGVHSDIQDIGNIQQATRYPFPGSICLRQRLDCLHEILYDKLATIYHGLHGIAFVSVFLVL